MQIRTRTAEAIVVLILSFTPNTYASCIRVKLASRKTNICTKGTGKRWTKESIQSISTLTWDGPQLKSRRPRLGLRRKMKFPQEWSLPCSCPDLELMRIRVKLEVYELLNMYEFSLYIFHQKSITGAKQNKETFQL